MKRRSKIRLAAFAAALFAAMLTWAVTATVKADRYGRALKLNDQQALTQLCEYFDNIEISLMKSQYANSDSMLSVLSSDLQKQATGAKTSLAALSSGETALLNTYKFLSQVGEYTAALNKKAAAGGSFTAEDRRTLETLLGYAAALATRFSYMADLMNSNYFTFDKLDKTVAAVEKSSESMVSFMDSVADAEGAMTDFPTLIYDGPFSDNILSKESELLKNAASVSPAQAKAKAMAYMTAQEEDVLEDGETDGRLAAYNFRVNGKAIAVSKNGGYLIYVLSDARAGSAKLTDTDAIENAAAFLYNVGYRGLMSTYYAVNDGVCTVNFAYIQDGYTCYPDLIKVGVSLSDGGIVSLDASDYLMNHVERAIPEAAVSAEEASAAVAETLTVKRASLAVIPTSGGGESFTHELLCETENGQDVLVYKDVTTGKEDDILILLYSDHGVLTK
ncbi:MAG: germination protein YpeB [Clostridia bacterium]|nr:germination protein YpeB [Clostridia bacterium]